MRPALDGSGKPAFSYAHPLFWAPYTLVGDGSFNAGQLYARLLAQVDWGQLVGGVAVAFVLVHLASEYRRRFVAT